MNILKRILYYLLISLILSSTPFALADEEDDILAELDEEFEDEGEKITINDPLEPLNRVIFNFNDKLFVYFLKPVAKGYRKVTPGFLRSGIKNFFTNLSFPIRFTASILQGKTKKAAIEFERFITNSTFGILGFIDVSSRTTPSLKAPSPEDMGQALGNMGIGHGFYLVLPFYGSSSLRDLSGKVFEYFLSPENINSIEESESYLIKGTDIINTTSFRIEDYESFKKASLDPYVAIKDFYINFRTKRQED